MQLIELIHRNNSWLTVHTELIRLYPEEEKQIDAYQDVYYKLMLLAPEPSGIAIRLREISDEGETYVDVHGYNINGQVDENSGNDALALDFTPWNQWLGMQLDNTTFQEFTELEIIAHCLYEMTYIAFDQEDIQEQLNELKRIVEKYENMSPEELNKYCKSLEDVLKELDDNEEDEDH